VILVTFLFHPSVVHAINKIWDDLIWPSVRSRLGGDALGELEEHDEDE
jgi:hypothetical protein